MTEARYSGARRLFKCLRLLRERPRPLAELQALLEISAPQLRRDLAFLCEELAADGQELEERGGAGIGKTVWIVDRPARRTAPR